MQESSNATFAPQIHRTVDQGETWSCSPQWCQRDIECCTRNTLGSEGKRRCKESYQKMHHMQKIWGETIHCSPPPLPWLAHRSCLWGTVFHVHGDRFCGTTLCQFCVTWETQQSILLPVYINTCCPPWVNWEFDSHLFLTSIPEDLLAEEDFQQSCWRTMRKPLSPHQWMLRRFQGLAKWSSILRTDKLMGSSSWNESLGGVVSGRDSCVV